MRRRVKEVVSAWLGRLGDKERRLVLGGGSAFIALVLVITGLWMTSAISKTQRRIAVKSAQLVEVMALKDAYRLRQAQRESDLAGLGRTNTRLVSVVEEVARQAGVEIGQLRPDDGEADKDGIMESRVNLKASKLSIDRLGDFLARLDNHPGHVVVRRLKVRKPYKQEELEVELLVTSLRKKT